MSNEYQYPDRDDVLFADMVASEFGCSKKAQGNISPARGSRFPAKLGRLGVFVSKTEDPRFSTYWAASETLALKRCLPLAFPSKKGIAKSADIGCGKGRLLKLLSERSGVVVGIEPSRDRFEEAARVADSLTNAIVVNGTAADLPSESFDVVLCSHVIQHLSFDEQDKLSAQILRILKPDGVAIITTTFTEGERSSFVVEYWKDGKRARDTIEEAQFNEAYGKDGMIPAQIFSRKDLLARFDGCEVVDFGCFHFFGQRNARRDAAFNRRGELSRAKDAYYVLKKAQHD